VAEGDAGLAADLWDRALSRGEDGPFDDLLDAIAPTVSAAPAEITTAATTAMK
jgi:hypothetical protein